MTIAGAFAVVAAAGGSATVDATSAAPVPVGTATPDVISAGPGSGSTAAAPQQPAEPASFDFTSTCTWSQREMTFDEGDVGPAVFSADCGPGADINATATYVAPAPDDPDVYWGRSDVQGENGGAAIRLEMQMWDLQDGSSPQEVIPAAWEGTIGDVPVSLAVVRDGIGHVILVGYTVGNGAIRAVGPQPDINSEAYDPMDYFIWDNPSIVTGRFYGDPNVTAAQTAALRQLISVGIPACDLLYFD